MIKMDQIQEYQEQIQKKNEDAAREYDLRTESLNARFDQYRRELKQILDQDLALERSLYERKKDAAKRSHEVRMNELQEDLRKTEEEFREKKQDRGIEKDETRNYYSRYREGYAADIGKLKAEIAQIRASVESLTEEYHRKKEVPEKTYERRVRMMDEEYERFSAECQNRRETRQKELFSQEGASDEQ